MPRKLLWVTLVCVMACDGTVQEKFRSGNVYVVKVDFDGSARYCEVSRAKYDSITHSQQLFKNARQCGYIVPWDSAIVEKP